MKFYLFMYCTVGRRAELEAGMAGQRDELYQRMLAEIAEYAGFADQAGYAGFGHPEHHLQIARASRRATIPRSWRCGSGSIRSACA